jgi:predicted DNA-binding transcriptional regulator AlpA
MSAVPTLAQMVTSALVPDPGVKPTMQVGDVAKAIGISRAAAYEGVKTGAIPSIRIGKRIVVPTAAVRRLLQLDSGPNAA